MFGRQNDVIAQDQKRDADVALPDDAMAALVKPPAASSQTDSPEPAKSAPAPAPDPAPSVPPPSVDSFSPLPTTASAMSPFDLVQKPVPAPAFSPGSSTDDSSTTQTGDEPAEVPDETAATQSTATDEGTLLGSDDTSQAGYLADDDDEPVSAVQPEPEPAEESSEETKEEEPKDEAPVTDTAEEKSEDTDTAEPITTGSGDRLLSIKQEALSQLSPLVGQLDLDAEEKFRTLMMLIQASDNQELIPEAYEAAQKIENEQTRAQALLDIVNEINYFTKDSKES